MLIAHDGTTNENGINAEQSNGLSKHHFADRDHGMP